MRLFDGLHSEGRLPISPYIAFVSLLFVDWQGRQSANWTFSVFPSTLFKPLTTAPAKRKQGILGVSPPFS
jgi:hypothetical protein